MTEELATAVNVALATEQPLLVTGEPGCGKTALAWAVAKQLGCDVLEHHVKSTSEAGDLLYTVDNIRRYHDAGVGVAAATDASGYITYGALGRAICAPHSTVVLIDEIDKAPREFPNDLLNELDRLRFTIAELTPPRTLTAKFRPFVLITSNTERRLPVPFLRRCAYFHIEFPDAERLTRIVTLHTGEPARGLVALAVERFLELRGVEGLVKRPATSELISWVQVLLQMKTPEAALRGPLRELPARSTLVKMLDDWERVERSGQ